MFLVIVTVFTMLKHYVIYSIFKSPEKINGWCDNCKKTLNPRSSYSLLFRLRIMGTEEENSCAVISEKEVFSDFCSSDNRWICQKKLNHDCNPCPDSWLRVASLFLCLPHEIAALNCQGCHSLTLPVQLVTQSMDSKTTVTPTDAHSHVFTL